MFRLMHLRSRATLPPSRCTICASCHQGGPCGYQGRDYLGSPTAPGVVLENQPFAWNPSITGTKSEDTILATVAGPEIITRGWVYAPEAEEFSFQDLSELNPQRTWSVAYRPVVLRFDPFDMSRSELILEQSRGAVIVDWIVRIFGAMFVFTALTLFACAVPVSRRAAAPFN